MEKSHSLCWWVNYADITVIIPVNHFSCHRYEHNSFAATDVSSSFAAEPHYSKYDHRLFPQLTLCETMVDVQLLYWLERIYSIICRCGTLWYILPCMTKVNMINTQIVCFLSSDWRGPPYWKCLVACLKSTRQMSSFASVNCHPSHPPATSVKCHLSHQSSSILRIRQSLIVLPR